MSNLKQLIEDTIITKVKESGLTYFRNPIVGYADAQDEIFQQFRVDIDPEYLLPADLTPNAKTVVAFFLPFTKDVVSENRQGEMATRNWAVTYTNTNKLISEICQSVEEVLKDQRIKVGYQPPTYKFDKVKLISIWSHKHTAYACGIGSFGLNHLLITEKGCGGRFGSFVIDADVAPSSRKENMIECFHHTKGCTYCIDFCPVAALSTEGFDRKKCYSRCQENGRIYNEGLAPEVCGKCCTGPCAYVG